MSTFEKLISKIFSGGQVSYKEAEKVLLKLGFEVQIMSSHHVFRKKGYEKNVSLKKKIAIVSLSNTRFKEGVN